MQTYTYQIGAMGYVNPNCVNTFENMLKDNLSDSPNRLYNFDAFMSEEKDIVVAVKLDVDEDGNLGAVRLTTSAQLKEEGEYNLKDCMEANMAAVGNMFLQDGAHDVTVAGEVIRVDDFIKAIENMSENVQQNM